MYNALESKSNNITYRNQIHLKDGNCSICFLSVTKTQTNEYKEFIIIFLRFFCFELNVKKCHPKSHKMSLTLCVAFLLMEHTKTE